MKTKLKGKVWKYPGFGGWYFFTVGKRVSVRIKAFMKGHTRGFGSIRVRARIGRTQWKTSIFPTKEGSYLLPVKGIVRKKEGLEEGDTVTVQLDLP